MKFNKLCLFSLLLLGLSITSCGNAPQDVIDSNLDLDEFRVINEKALANNEIIINLTRVGLLDDAPGEKLAEYFLENSKVLTLNAGDLLPANVTSTSKNASFAGWVYYKEGGILSSTTKVIKGINYYQAHFERSGDIEVPPTENPTDTPTNPDIGGETTAIYFKDQAWWAKDGAKTGIYTWGPSGEQYGKWPGTCMTSIGDGVWKIDIDLSNVDGLIFVRVNKTAKEGEKLNGQPDDWGAKTVNITKKDLGDNNFVTLKETTAVWGDPGCKVSYSSYTESK